MKIQIKVIPKSSHSQVIGWEGNVLKIQCREVPEKGKVNREVTKLLYKYFKVPKESIKILFGKSCSRKLIEITHLSEEEIDGNPGT